MCTPRAPSCASCPVAPWCAALAKEQREEPRALARSFNLPQPPRSALGKAAATTTTKMKKAKKGGGDDDDDDDRAAAAAAAGGGEGPEGEEAPPFKAGGPRGTIMLLLATVIMCES